MVKTQTCCKCEYVNICKTKDLYNEAVQQIKLIMLMDNPKSKEKWHDFHFISIKSFEDILVDIQCRHYAAKLTPKHKGGDVENK